MVNTSSITLISSSTLSQSYTSVWGTSAIFSITLFGWGNRNVFRPFFVLLNLAGKRSHLITKTWHLYVLSWNWIFFVCFSGGLEKGKNKIRNDGIRFDIFQFSLVNWLTLNLSSTFLIIDISHFFPVNDRYRISVFVCIRRRKMCW